MSTAARHVVTVVGARPQFVKAAMVTMALASCTQLRETLIHTGQHYDRNMSEVFFEELGIKPPSRNLGIGGGSHGQNTGRMIEALESAFVAEQPAAVIVFGDTDSTLAATIAAIKLRIPVAHVEAGLRSFNRSMPEEQNRVLTDHAASMLYAPTETAIRNLAREGLEGNSVVRSGDVMFDATRHFSAIALARANVTTTMPLAPGSYVLATIHRQENTDDAVRLSGILEGFAMYGAPIVLPLHPRTRQSIDAFGLSVPANVKPISPVGYLDMLALEAGARAIATDSGGVQKEAFFCGVPCVTLRSETEWVELVDAGVNCLVGQSPSEIALALNDARPLTDLPTDLYGDGSAAECIARHLESCLER